MDALALADKQQMVQYIGFALVGSADERRDRSELHADDYGMKLERGDGFPSLYTKMLAGAPERR